MNNLQKVNYIWRAVCSDGGWDDRSQCVFGTLKECYDNMRDAALDKLHYNTEIDEMQLDEGPVYWKLTFDGEEKSITLHSEICGTYTYKVIEISNFYYVNVEELDDVHGNVKEVLDYLRTPFFEDADNRFNQFEEQYLDRKTYKGWIRTCADVAPIVSEGIVRQEVITWAKGYERKYYRISISEEPYKA